MGNSERVSMRERGDTTMSDPSSEILGGITGLVDVAFDKRVDETKPASNGIHYDSTSTWVTMPMMSHS